MPIFTAAAAVASAVAATFTVANAVGFVLSFTPSVGLSYVERR